MLLMSTSRYSRPVPTKPTPATTPYHHGRLREALVETGFAMAREAGPDGVALREVARRVGVSHNAAYRHFADRDELLSEIAAEAGDLLTETMRTRVDALATGGKPAARALARLREVGRAYIEFALAEPGLFRVVFSAKVDDAEDSPEGPSREGPYGVLNEILDELVEAGYLAPPRRAGSEVVCWAAVHGFSELCLDGPLRLLPAEAREVLVERLLGVIEVGLAGG